MGASEKQKLKCRLLLGVTGASAKTALEAACDSLDVEGLAELEDILSAAAKIELRQVNVKADGIEFSQETQLDNLRVRLGILLEISNAFAGQVLTISPDTSSQVALISPPPP